MKFFIAITIIAYSFSSFAKVENCERKAQILKGLVEHHWLKTDTKIAGMGSLDAISDIQIGNKFEAPYSTHVFVIDHSNQEPESCKEVLNVDEDCVNEALDIGKPLGRFSLVNNCQTFVAKVVRKCSTLKSFNNEFDSRYSH